MNEEIGVKRITFRKLEMRRNNESTRVILAKKENRFGSNDFQTIYFLQNRNESTHKPAGRYIAKERS